MQQNKNSIETELMKALHKVGCVIESNIENNLKIGWSRSSRTDKNVHASRIVVSAKLLIDLSNINSLTGRVDGLCEALNNVLSYKIRVFSCTIVRGNFRAREQCNTREYLYYIPIRFLQSLCHKEEDFDALTQRFCDILPIFQGSYDFHNFTRRIGQSDKNAQACMTRRHVYISNCDRNIYDIDGEQMLIYKVKAQGFLLHQIRTMIGAAIGHACGYFTKDYILAALGWYNTLK
jgi:tRNA pseudouridine(38-40) synthase